MDKTLFPEDPRESPPEPQLDAVPLAERMRPRRLEEVLGQDHLLAEGRFLREALQGGLLPSLILWGPPGVGKTTLARLLARESRAAFVPLSAVLSGVKEIKRVVEEARRRKIRSGQPTILFIDEIHRFNKAQQDAFLPHVEQGTVTLIGATTENPSFEIIPPLLSRCRVLVLNPLREEDLFRLLRRALEDPRGLAWEKMAAEEKLLVRIARFADGDARTALNFLEAAAHLARRKNPRRPQLTEEILSEALQTRTLRHDKAGEEHFNLISALHKSLRNSDVDASLYWLARLLEAGEDPLYVARRLVRVASEDVGLADPSALGVALQAMQAVDFIGLPEGKLALAQAAIYLAQAPKSNSVDAAYSRAARDVHEEPLESVPLHLRNAPTRLLKDLGYGQGYRYAHDEEGAVADMECLPEGLQGRCYYTPSPYGYEELIQRRLRQSRARRKKTGSADPES